MYQKKMLIAPKDDYDRYRGIASIQAVVDGACPWDVRRDGFIDPCEALSEEDKYYTRPPRVALGFTALPKEPTAGGVCPSYQYCGGCWNQNTTPKCSVEGWGGGGGTPGLDTREACEESGGTWCKDLHLRL